MPARATIGPRKEASLCRRMPFETKTMSTINATEEEAVKPELREAVPNAFCRAPTFFRSGPANTFSCIATKNQRKLRRRSGSLVAQSFNGIEAGGFVRGPQSKENSDTDRHSNAGNCRPKRHTGG